MWCCCHFYYPHKQKIEKKKIINWKWNSLIYIASIEGLSVIFHMAKSPTVITSTEQYQHHNICQIHLVYVCHWTHETHIIPICPTIWDSWNPLKHQSSVLCIAFYVLSCCFIPTEHPYLCSRKVAQLNMADRRLKVVYDFDGKA